MRFLGFSSILSLIVALPVWTRFDAPSFLGSPIVKPFALPKAKSEADGITTLTAPKSVTSPVGKKCIVTVETNAKKVTWKVPSGVDYEVLDKNRLGVWAMPGDYKIMAMVPNGDDVISVDVPVSITGSISPPVTDKVLESLQTAYSLEPEETRADDKVKLIAVYRASAAGLDDLSTNTALFTAIKNTTEARIQTRLPKVRGVLNAEFASFLSKTGDTALTDAQKKQAKDTLTTYASLLENGVK